MLDQLALAALAEFRVVEGPDRNSSNYSNDHMALPVRAQEALHDCHSPEGEVAVHNTCKGCNTVAVAGGRPPLRCLHEAHFLHQ